MGKALWCVYATDCSTVQVVPMEDLVEHAGDDCVCGPTTEPVPREDGSIGWVVTHHSLDGRELHEPDRPSPT
ncbi:unannotated protein [freshwater metagenome]|uniref:Unannotated protein n=1 Tax=freshwater metagenome TaxID=449393 RepID=A0A6J7GRP6_9ZZZZ|nr:hypothetical protein [Actinomycetota bacterium]